MVERSLLKSALLACGLLGLTAFNTPDAMAVDTKFYPGSACAEHRPTDPRIHRIWGSAENRSTTRQLIAVCPVIWHSSNISKIEVHAIDRSSAQDVACSFQSVSRVDDGRLVIRNRRAVKTRGIDSKPQRLIIPRPARPEGRSTLVCTIPKGGGSGFSSIETYVLQEL